MCQQIAWTQDLFQNVICPFNPVSQLHLTYQKSLSHTDNTYIREEEYKEEVREKTGHKNIVDIIV
jgi:hypothetical protein